jgi:hypothetical protein
MKLEASLQRLCRSLGDMYGFGLVRVHCWWGESVELLLISFISF